MARRLILFTVLTALLVGGCVWLADRPGEVTIHWQGWRLDTTVPVLVFTNAGLLALILLAQHLTRWVVGAPLRWLAVRRALRQRRGYQALSDGLAAIITGDAAKAKKLAATAQSLLHDPQVTGLLSAQAAGLAGEDQSARSHYQILLARPETALSGCQGMLGLALKQGDQAAALDWARRAWATGTDAAYVARTLYDQQARAGQWAEAELTVIEAQRRKALPKAQGNHLLAVALYERALQPHAAAEALSLAQKAHQLAPALVPVAVLTAQLLAAAGKMRRANAVLHQAWDAAPHGELAQAWADLVPHEAPLDRVSRLQPLLTGRQTSPEGLLALARAELAAQLWGPARAHLEAVVQQRPSRNAYLLLSSLERHDCNDLVRAGHWADLADAAAPDAQWQCEHCGHHAPHWHSLCPQCGQAASFTWPVP